MNRLELLVVRPLLVTQRGAYTLLELMISVGIVSVLVGILLPVFALSKTSGYRALLLANQREAMRVVEQYASDHQDEFPNAGDESGVTASWRWNGKKHQTDYWTQPEHWGWYVQSLGYDGFVSMGPDATPGVFGGREDCMSCGLGVRSLHVLSPTVLAEPEQFVDGAEIDRMLTGAARLQDVSFPASKGVLTQMYFRPTTGEEAPPWLIHFADGHGANIYERDLHPGVRLGIPFGGLPVMTTADGVRGRDVK